MIPDPAEAAEALQVLDGYGLVLLVVMIGAICALWLPR